MVRWRSALCAALVGLSCNTMETGTPTDHSGSASGTKAAGSAVGVAKPASVSSSTPDAAGPVSAAHRVVICHIPPGNPENAHTIVVSESAVPAHLAHGDTLGPCSEACTPAAGCSEPDEYCQLDVGVCDENAWGVCALMPELCIDIWDPVCGCDGTTYSNACYAHREGVNVAHDGACPGGCFANEDCPLGGYCLTPPAACDGPGECVERPGDNVQCLAVWDPVCGCDGQTYSNGCYAAKAGVSVDYEGECWY